MPFKNWTYPWGPIISVVLNIFLVLVQGWTAFSPRFKAVDFVSFYIEIPVLLGMLVLWKIVKRSRFVRSDEMDLFTDRYDAKLTPEEREELLSRKTPFLGQTWIERFKTVGTLYRLRR